MSHQAQRKKPAQILNDKKPLPAKLQTLIMMVIMKINDYNNENDNKRRWTKW